MSVYDECPWLGLYGGQPTTMDPEFGNGLDMFRAGLGADPTGVAVRYFDGVLSRRELDEQSDALAVALLARGFGRGDRLAVYLQNVPQFLVCLLGAWKAGGVMVSVNPMSRTRELSYLLKDSGARVLVSLETLYDEVAREVVPDTAVGLVLTTSELEYQTRCDPRLFSGVSRQRYEGTTDFTGLIEQYRGQVPPPVQLAPDDVAFLTYTSGTTGVPKGAMNTHRNVVFTAGVYRDWARFGPGGSVFGIAPLFHITGLIGHIAVTFLAPSTLVLAYRFEPHVVLDALLEHRPTCTVGAITAFTALLNCPQFTRDHFSSFTSVYSGGAAISPTAERAFAEATGKQVHNAYGLTETTSPLTLTPFGASSPVDPTSGALSVGVPAPSTIVRIQDEQGHDLPLGEVGEIVAQGPQVVTGYWGKPEETAVGLPGGALKTGDVGFMNPQGWVFIVDRKKDMINASGYKVWPREVEDVLAEHPAVRESAVIGVADEKRGETVKAYVSLKAGAQVTPEELIAHCKARMAAYKYPRHIEFLDELPKTVTGKILRRELRDAQSARTSPGDVHRAEPAEKPPQVGTMTDIATRRVQMAQAMRGWTEPHGYFEATEAGFAVLSGYPTPDGNMVVLADADEVAYARLLGAVDQVGVPALVMFTDAAEAFGKRLPTQWAQVGELPVMSRSLPDGSATMDPRVRVATAADEDAVGELLMGAYGMPREVYPLITTCLRVADDRQRLWLLEDPHPVSCVLSGRVDDTVSLWAMATPPQFARRGYGRALLDSVVSWAGTDGARIGLLGATPAGLPLYEHTGWTTVEYWHIWTNAASDQFPPH